MTQCNKCGYTWEYTGSLEMTTCPSCQRKTRVEHNETTDNE